MKSNIPKLYIIRAIRWFLLIMPVSVLFFQENGLTMREVFILQSIFSIVVVILEVPSGYFADVFGRKNAIIIGSFFAFLGFLTFSFSYGFWGFLLAESLLGFGSSFVSGADSAFLYDTLVDLKESDKYSRIEGKYSAIGNFSESTAAIIGGFLASISLRYPFYIETIILLFAVPIALTLREPKRHKLKTTDGNLRSILRLTKYALHDHKEIKWLIIYSSLVQAGGLVMVWMIQPYFSFVGLPLVFFGLAWACLNFSTGVFSIYAYKFERFFGRTNSLFSLVILLFIGFMSLSVIKSLWGIGLIFIFYFVRGINEPVLKDYINQLIGSDIRATVLSVKQLMGRMIFTIIGPFIGWINDLYTLQVALFMTGIIFFVPGLVSLFFLRKVKVV